MPYTEANYEKAGFEIFRDALGSGSFFASIHSFLGEKNADET